MLVRGLLLGTASDAVQMITSGMTAFRSSGATLLWAVVSIKFGSRSDLSQFDDAMGAASARGEKR
jgi:hypothetical protein